MAKRKRKTTRRKRTRTLSAGGGGVRRRRSSRRRRGFLSDMFNPTVAMNSARAVGSAAIGGFGAVIANKVIIPATAGKGVRLLAALIPGFLLANFGLPNVAAGYTGGAMALTFQSGLLNEDAEFAQENVLSDQPLFLDEDGTVMVLEEGPGGESFYREVTDEEAAALQEAGAFDTDYELV